MGNKSNKKHERCDFSHLSFGNSQNELDWHSEQCSNKHKIHHIHISGQSKHMEYRKCTSTMNETDPDLKTEMKVESVCQVKQRSIFKQQL